MAYSDGEYFAMLLDVAVQGQDAGDYGMAAALVIRARKHRAHQCVPERGSVGS
jgi:hypothetical protein